MSSRTQPDITQTFTCPLPLDQSKQIMMGHGSGGQMSHDLIQRSFLKAFDNVELSAGNDAGVVELPAKCRLAVSTDSHVVWPLFFPGGDIGRLAVCGTVNDVAMIGAKQLHPTVGCILEEGLEIHLLDKVVDSMRKAALEADVRIVAGDTKVVQKGKADGIFISTTGVGAIPRDVNINGQNARPGDLVILSGHIGDHGIAVLSARGDLDLDLDVESDVAPLNKLVGAMLKASGQIHTLRDPTRGGVASTLIEIAQQSKVGIVIDETKIPVRPAVNAACELLGFDPLYIANEGRLIAILAPENAPRVLAAMRDNKYGTESTIIGRVTSEDREQVLLKTGIGSLRVVNSLAGEMLPRIC